MVQPQASWQIQPPPELPPDWPEAVRQVARLEHRPQFGAQLLWQRGVRTVEQLRRFLNPADYQPASPFNFGTEMEQAVARLIQAREQGEKVAIWGDFDADGITSTAVLWDGLGQFFAPEQLTYFIPNRLKESHGLARVGLEQLAAQGFSLVVTCDTGSTNLAEIDHAQQLGLSLIITDHHTLPPERPPVEAIINPRSLPSDHPLADLSGVATAYKLVEALYQRLPDIPERPLAELLDLVAIGLIADLVALTGDCRYLAQVGIQQLKRASDPAIATRRPGVTRLLQLCRRTGDRPTDISFGIGPRINAVSRIHGDAGFCVELLTSQDAERCKVLAEQTEDANARRKALQKDVLYQVTQQLASLDLSTTGVIVLTDPQWPVGILGLVAGQIAQQYGKPTILLTLDAESANSGGPRLARGSARSVNKIDLYQLVQAQAHLLHSFGGHPFAAGLSLPVENLPLFTEAVNRQLRQTQALQGDRGPTLAVDLTVTVADLGADLFRQLSLLEPCGMGNPAPKLLIKDAWFERTWHQNLRDRAGRKLSYIKTEFRLCDETQPEGFAGIWWEHYKDELPPGRCAVVVELDYNSHAKASRYEVRLIDLRSAEGEYLPQIEPFSELAPPAVGDPLQTWETLVGLAKYLSRTGETASREQLCAKLGIGDRTLTLGLSAIAQLGFELTQTSDAVSFSLPSHSLTPAPQLPRAELQQFLDALREEQFRRLYFDQVPATAAQPAISNLR